MRFSQLIAICALALVGFCFADSQYASASHRDNVLAIQAGGGNTVVQQQFGLFGRLRSQTVVNGNGAVAIQQQRHFRPAALRVEVRRPFVQQELIVQHQRNFVRQELLVQHQPAYVQSQLLVNPRFRTSLNVLNTYSYPANTAANIVYSQPQTVILQQPPPTQFLVVPAAQAQPVADPAQYQQLPPQTALPVQTAPLAVTQPVPVAVQQPAYVVQPVLAVRGRYGLALRGC